MSSELETGEPVIKKDDPKGVGGWLLFFCVLVTIIIPLLWLREVVGVVNTWGEVQAVSPTINLISIWMLFGSTLLMIFGFIVGYIIWSGNPNGKSLAKKYLLIFLLVSIGFIVVAGLLAENLPSNIAGAIGKELGKTIPRKIAFFLLWWFYFKKSKRVQNTYG